MISPMPKATPKATAAGAAEAVAVEVHHEIPRCLLRLRDRADEHTELDGAALQAWLDFELEATRWGVDPDIARDDLSALIDASTVRMPAENHRHTHAEDFRRWGRLGGLATVRRYGTVWYALLARRRWNRITAEALAESFAAMNGGRS